MDDLLRWQAPEASPLKPVWFTPARRHRLGFFLRSAAAFDAAAPAGTIARDPRPAREIQTMVQKQIEYLAYRRLRVHPQTLNTHRRDAGATRVLGCTVSHVLLWGAVLSVGTGCAEVVIRPNPALVPQGRSAVYADSDWALVLQNCVREGLVDYDALAQKRDNLDRYYALISVTGPSRTPSAFVSRPARTAYWINAYNALVIRAVLERYPVVTMYDLSLPVLEYQYKFIVDGQVRHLASIESEILKESANDVRALFAMSGAALGTPPLASEPFRPDTLERQLARAAGRALDAPHICQVDHATRSILVWQKILRRQEDFLSSWRERRRVRTAYLFNVLLDMATADRRRTLQSAVGYQFREIPFDRMLNRYPLRPLQQVQQCRAVDDQRGRLDRWLQLHQHGPYSFAIESRKERTGAQRDHPGCTPAHLIQSFVSKGDQPPNEGMVECSAGCCFLAGSPSGTAK